MILHGARERRRRASSGLDLHDLARSARSVAALALAWVVAIGCGGAPGPRATENGARPERSFDGTDWQSLAPAGANLVVGARVAELAAWPPIWSLVAALAADPLAQLAALEDRCAIDARDVVELVWLRYADGDLVVVGGRFTPGEARACAEALLEARGAALERSTLRGHELFASDAPGDPGWLVAPRSGVALVATSRAVIDRALAGATPRVAEAPGWLGGARVARDGAALWAAAGPASRPARALADLGVGVEVVSIGAGLLRDGDRGVVVAAARSHTPESAAVLATLLRRTLDGARESLDRLGLVGLASRLEVETDDVVTRARLVLEAAELAALAARRQDSRSR